MKSARVDLTPSAFDAIELLLIKIDTAINRRVLAAERKLARQLAGSEGGDRICIQTLRDGVWHVVDSWVIPEGPPFDGRWTPADLGGEGG